MKFVLGALAAVALFAGVAASQPAEARCFWNGFAWQCWQPHHFYGPGPGYWHRHYYWGY